MSQMNEIDWAKGILKDKQLIAAIARKTKKMDFNIGRHVAIYEGESTLYVLSDIQNGWETRGNEIKFYKPMTQKQVENEVKLYLDFLLFSEEIDKISL